MDRSPEWNLPPFAESREHGVRHDLPEFLAWALVYQAESGDSAKIALARTAAAGIVNPALQARVRTLYAALAGGDLSYRPVRG